MKPLLALFACAVLPQLSSAAPGMTLGASFWNLGWHKAGDCFQNIQQVAGENPGRLHFLREIAIYRILCFMD